MHLEKEVFKLLGVEEKEPFYLFQGTDSVIGTDVEFRINEELGIEIRNKGQVSWVNALITIQSLLSGNFSIVKKSPAQVLTQRDKFIIAYAKACGYQWIAEDKDGEAYAYYMRPERSRVCEGSWSDAEGAKKPAHLLACSLSFMSWDSPAFFLGDIEIKLEEDVL